MATIPINLQIITSTNEDNRTDSDTNLSTVDTKDELHTDINTWTPADRKKLQHMTEFHEEYCDTLRNSGFQVNWCHLGN